jgi:hypothetical protein
LEILVARMFQHGRNHEATPEDPDRADADRRGDRAGRRLNLAATKHERVILYSGEVTGLAVRLPEWQYPVGIDTETGSVQYDNFGGRWGEQKHLDALLQMYAVEKAKIEARRRGHACTEQRLIGIYRVFSAGFQSPAWVNEQRHKKVAAIQVKRIMNGTPVSGISDRWPWTGRKQLDYRV